MTAISLYGLMDEKSDASVHRSLSELIHVDIKKQGRIPIGGGWRVHGRPAMPGHHRGAGYDFIHAAIDDRSRLAYAEIMADERKETACAFMRRAIAFFAERVLTDNGSCYRSKEFVPRWPMPASPIAGPAPTDPRPTARSNGST